MVAVPAPEAHDPSTREAIRPWLARATNAVSRLHQQLAEVGIEHITQVEGPGQQLSLDRQDDDA